MSFIVQSFGFGIGIAIAIAIAIGVDQNTENIFQLYLQIPDSDSDPDTDSDTEIWSHDNTLRSYLGSAKLGLNNGKQGTRNGKRLYSMAYLIIVSFIWGFSFVIIKGSLTSLDSNFVSFFRLLLSLVVFVPFLRPSGVRSRDAIRLAAIGSVQFGFMYVAYVASYQYLPAHTIVLMTTTTPLFVSIIHSMYDGKVRKVFLVTACMAVAGGIVLVYPKQALEAGVYGVVLMQISNVAFAFGQVAYKKFMKSRPSLKDKNAFGYMYAGAVVTAGGFALFTMDSGRLSVQSRQWLALAYLGIIASGICFFLWNLGVRRVHAGAVAVMNNLKIPVGVVASLAILHETADYPRLLAGCILFAAALWLNARVEIPDADS